MGRMVGEAGWGGWVRRMIGRMVGRVVGRSIARWFAKIGVETLVAARDPLTDLYSPASMHALFCTGPNSVIAGGQEINAPSSAVARGAPAVALPVPLLHAVVGDGLPL